MTRRPVGQPADPDQPGFLFKSTPENRVLALYPSPAGATESLLSLDTWDDIVHENPVLTEMEADVEALLVNRLDRGRPNIIWRRSINAINWSV